MCPKLIIFLLLAILKCGFTSATATAWPGTRKAEPLMWPARPGNSRAASSCSSSPAPGSGAMLVSAARPALQFSGTAVSTVVWREVGGCSPVTPISSRPNFSSSNLANGAMH